MKLSLLSRSLGIVALLAVGNAAHAQTLGLDFTGGSNFTISNGFGTSATIGWSFSVTSPLSVVSLGVWDQGADGLNNPKQVALWSNSNTTTPLAQTTVTSASTPVSSSQTSGDWLFETLASPVTLAAGDYTIGAFYSTTDQDRFYQGTNTPTTASGITFTQDESDNTNSLAFPTTTFGINAFFGPNFQVVPAAPAVPEPGIIALLVGMGASGAGFLMRRSRK